MVNNLPKVDPVTRKNLTDDLIQVRKQFSYLHVKINFHFQLIQILNDDSVDQNVVIEIKKSTVSLNLMFPIKH